MSETTLLRWPAIIFIAAGVGWLALYIGWSSTRNLEPIHAPLSLAPGRTTYTFQANVDYAYSVELDVVSALPLRQLSCAAGDRREMYSNAPIDCIGQPKLLDLHWTVLADGVPIPNTPSVDGALNEPRPNVFEHVLGSFEGKAGQTYVVTVDLKHDAQAISKYVIFRVSVAPLYGEGLSVGLLASIFASFVSLLIAALFLAAYYRRRRTLLTAS